MLERQLSELTQLLLADDPKRGCQRALQVLGARNGARVAALFTVGTGEQRLRLFASEALDQAALDVAGSAFVLHRKALAAGETVRQGAGGLHGLHAVLSPIIDDGDRLVAVVYLDSTDSRFLESIDIEGIQAFSNVLAAAVAGGNVERAVPQTPSNPESYLELTAPHEVRRHQLLLLLERHEWNVARVARAMGCARMTIYSWLSRYGIERRRIRKTKPRVAPAG